MAGNRPINKPVRGIRDSIPGGYMLGRVGNGNGPPILLPIGQFTTKGFVANTTIQQGGPAGGDLSGTFPNPTVAKIQGEAISATPPTNKQFLMWIAANNDWEATTPNVPGSAKDDGTTFYLAMIDADGQLVLDAPNGDPIFAPEVLPAAAVPFTLPTTQKLTSGSGATYTPTSPAVKWIKVRMVGAGGGAAGAGSLAGDASNGTTGGDTIFNSVHAAGGSTGGRFGGGGNGGTGGAGTANFRTPGDPGGLGYLYNANLTASQTTDGSIGASSLLGAGAGNSVSAPANTGGGGGGGHLTDPGTANTTGIDGGGGGAGEYVELILAATTYTYTVGAKGTGGAAGTRGTAGGNGSDGAIWIEEYYL